MLLMLSLITRGSTQGQGADVGVHPTLHIQILRFRIVMNMVSIL